MRSLLLPPHHAPVSPSPWAIALVASLVHSLHACAVYIAPATLLRPISESLNASIASVTLPLTAYRAVQALFLLPAGYAIDRIGAQTCIRVSITLAALFSPFVALVASVRQLLVVMVVLSCTKLGGGLGALLVIVHYHWREHTATATGVLVSGYSLAGFLAPALIGLLESSFGWRVAVAIMAALLALPGLPLLYCFLHAPPPSPSIHHQSDDTAAIAPHQPLLSAPFVLVLLMMGAFSFSLHIVLDHFLIFLVDISIPFAHATIFMSALNLIVMFCKLVLSPLGDRYNKSLLIAALSVISLLSCFLLFDTPSTLTRSHVRLWLFVALYPIGYAATYTLTFAMLPEFGNGALGRRANINLIVLFACGGIGSAVAADLRTRHGDYLVPFAINAFVWIVVIAAALVKFVAFDRRKSSFMRLADE